MIKVIYGIIEERYTLGNESRVSYGISAYSDANENGTATIVSSVHDITSNKESLVRLVDDCNRLKLSTVHLHDVVEDFLSDQCTIKKQVQENLHTSISKERVFLSQIGLLSSEIAALGGFCYISISIGQNQNFIKNGKQNICNIFANNCKGLFANARFHVIIS